MIIARLSPPARGFATAAASLAIGFSLSMLGGPAGALTLEEAVRAALKTNPDVLISRDDARIAAFDTDQARAGYFPSLDTRASTGAENVDNPTNREKGDYGSTMWRNEGNVTLRQMLFDGFGVQSDVARARAREAAAGERVRVSANSVALAAIEAYLEVLRNRELARVAEINVRQHEDSLSRSRVRAGQDPNQPGVSNDQVVGRGDASELPRAESRTAGARATLEQARGRLRDAEVIFQRVVGAPPGELAPLPPLARDFPGNEGDALQRASAASPAIKAANKDIDAAMGELGQADARFMPRFDVELSGTRGKNLGGLEGMSSDNTALLVMRYNLYQGGADTARRRASLERLAKARNTLLLAQRNLDQETHASWNALITARDRQPILSEQLRQSVSAREAYRQQFDLGRKTVIDLMDAEADYFNASNSVVTGDLTVRFGEYRVMAATYALFGALGIADPEVIGAANGSLK